MIIKALKILVVCALIHVFLTIGLFIVGFDLSPMDTGIPSPLWKQQAMQMAKYLMYPLFLLKSKDTPNLIEWLIFCANSILCGLKISIGYIALTSKKKQ